MVIHRHKWDVRVDGPMAKIFHCRGCDTMVTCRMVRPKRWRIKLRGA